MLNTLNEQLFFLINRAAGQSNFLDHFFVFVSNFFVPAMIVLTFFWFLFGLRDQRKTIWSSLDKYKNLILFLFSLGVVSGVVECIKVLIAFPRPIQILSGVHSLIIDGSYDSFPSLHTAFAFAIAAFVYQYSKSTGVILFLFATLVGISRIFVGVHFPLDVLVGAIMGTLITWGIVSMFRGDNI